MISFRCPHCGNMMEALEGRSRVVCEACGQIVEAPSTSDVPTLTLEELKALRKQLKPNQT